MKHPLSRIFGGIAIIVGVALSTAALAADHGMKEPPKAGNVDVAVAADEQIQANISASKQIRRPAGTR